MGNACSSVSTVEGPSAKKATILVEVKYQRAPFSLDQPLPAEEQQGPSKEARLAQRAADAASARDRYLAQAHAQDALAVERLASQRYLHVVKSQPTASRSDEGAPFHSCRQSPAACAELRSLAGAAQTSPPPPPCSGNETLADSTTISSTGVSFRRGGGGGASSAMLHRDSFHRSSAPQQGGGGSACTYDLLQSMTDSQCSDDDTTTDGATTVHSAVHRTDSLTPKLRRLRGAPRHNRPTPLNL